ncbi:phage tail tip lysozyme, partial [Enterococcus sp. C76]
MKKGCGCCLGLFLFFPILLLICISNIDISETTTDFSPITEQEKVAYQVYNFVLEHKGSKEFACAWIGNMEHESGLDPTAIQSHLTFNSAWAYDPSCNGYAFGLAQWDGGRRVNLLNFAKGQAKDWKTTEVQLIYAWEHDGSDSQLLRNMSTATDLSQLTIDLLMNWERAGT